MKDKNKLIIFFGLIPLLSVILVSVALITISIVGINKYFHQEMQKEAQEIKYNTIYQSKKEIKAVYGLINNINIMVMNSFRREIKISVNIGERLIENIYNNNKNLSKEKIIKKIKNQLKNIRFYNDKSGYFFIYNMKGKLIMLPVKENLENTNFWNYRDIVGRYVIRNLINRLKKHPKGVFGRWYYYKKNSAIIYDKLGYSIYFKPLDIFVGSAIDENIIQKVSYKRIKQFISKISIKNNSKELLIMDNAGDIIYSSNRKLLETNQSKHFRKILNLAKQNPDKLDECKIGNKLMMFDYYKPLNLSIIQEVDLDKLHKIMENQMDNMNNVVHLVIKQFLITTAIFIILILAAIYYFTNLIKKIFYRYDESLNQEKERAEAAAKAKAEFLANMSHEIRTPLNAMFGFIVLLQDKNLDKESKQYLTIVEKSAHNLLVIINDILDFSKIESGKFKIEYIEFNPKEEINVICELFSSKASQRDILLNVKTKNLKYNIVSDPTRIKQVIANLLSNAIKFTPEDKDVNLYMEYNDKKEELFVCVQDQGIGIEKTKLNHIFEAFSQADASTTRKYGGTGLGLTISYKLVKLLGGELKVESEVGKGSKFYFTIPAKKGKIAKEINHKNKKIIDEKFDYHILVVEDNAANQMFMKIILEKMGLTFDMANNGKIAVEKFMKNSYDFILMDENMPEMNGIEATKKIRKIEKEKNLKHTIIIALTANSLEGDKEKFINAGMDYYLSKPLDIEKLKILMKKIKETK